MRGIRGATTITANEREAIFSAVRELLVALIEKNQLAIEDIGAALFSATEDITAAFPAAGARTLPNWEFVPLFDTRQIAVEDGLKLCIRILLLVDTQVPQNKICHVYLHGTDILRPDLCKKKIPEL